jgi:L-aminopeptidase/D-esterase-like protein
MILPPGLKVGHATDEEALTGCTVFLCPPGTVGGVDMRGPAPGSRETELLSPYKAVMTINAVLFTGGSAFGLAAADGVVKYLAEMNIGHPTPIRPVPIVAAAVVYDLFMGDGQRTPDADMGYQACLSASEELPAQGNVGAGTGVTVGKWSGSPFTMMKGGFGLSTFQEDDLIVGAAVVTNCIGDVIESDGTVLAGARADDGSWLVEQDRFRRYPDLPPANLGTSTTLALVFTNAVMDKIGTNRLAQRAHDGMAIAVQPVHTTHDGDAVFSLATCAVDAPFDLVANIAAEMVAKAIRNSVRNATSVGEIRGLASNH